MGQSMRCTREELLLYAVTERSYLKGKNLCLQVEEALKGGVTCLQLREKELEPAAFLQEAKEMKRVCQSYQVPLIINDELTVALASDADGIHVGQSDMSAKEVRQRIGRDKILGVSVQTVEQAVKAEQDGADYLGVGAVFPTNSKDDALEVSHQMLQKICAAVQIPVIAIGGITKENVSYLAGSGICGVAVISAIFAQKDVKAASEELKEKVVEMVW